jgi:hypothetical protein
MWILTLTRDTAEARDNTIAELLGEPINETFVGFRFKRFTHSNSVTNAKVYTNKATVVRFVNEFEKDVNKNRYSNKYHSIQNFKVSYRKLTLQEWNQIIDSQLHNIEQTYLRHKKKIESNRNKFK